MLSICGDEAEAPDNIIFDDDMTIPIPIDRATITPITISRLIFLSLVILFARLGRFFSFMDDPWFYVY
jgi:hypothetical protein